MKNNKIYFFIVALICSLVFISCKNNNEDDTNEREIDQITMVVSSPTTITITIAGIGKAFIDWGDSTGEEYILNSSEKIYNHAYKYGGKQRTINIVGGEVTIFHCDGNKVKSLDVSKKTKLVELYCHDNILSNLDVSKNKKLTLLSCCKNNLSYLNVSKNIKLTDLYCWGNNLKKLNVSKNTELIFLSCAENQLTNLDVSKNSQLVSLLCFENNLSAASLDALFETLPDRSSFDKSGIIEIWLNPGANSCDKSIPVKKNWHVVSNNKKTRN